MKYKVGQTYNISLYHVELEKQTCMVKQGVSQCRQKSRLVCRVEPNEVNEPEVMRTKANDNEVQ